MTNQLVGTPVPASLVSFYNGQAVTTSLAIAEGTQIEHASIIKLVRTYQTDLEEFGEVRFEIRLNPQGSPTEYALLNEQQSTLILTYMRNSEIVRGFKKRLVKAFWELARKVESQPVALNPANFSRLQLIELAMQAEQERLVLEAHVKIIEPKAQALDRISAAEGSQCVTDAAKALKIQPKQLFLKLQEMEWIYRRAGGKNWLGYQDKIQAGYLEHRITTIEKTDGTEKVVEQLLITPKGIAKLSALLNSQDENFTLTPAKTKANGKPFNTQANTQPQESRV